MWIDYLPFAALAHIMYNSSNLSNYSPYELVFGRKLKLLLDLETDPDIKVLVTYKEYYKRIVSDPFQLSLHPETSFAQSTGILP